MNRKLYTFILIILVLGVGILDGLLPQSFIKKIFKSPDTISIIATDKSLLPPTIQKRIESTLGVKINLEVVHDQFEVMQNRITSNQVDLILIPSHWEPAIDELYNLIDLGKTNPHLLARISPDFLYPETSTVRHFLPLYWIKLHLDVPNKDNLDSFLKSNKNGQILLFNDQDLFLKHLRDWQSLDLVKVILERNVNFLDLDSYTKKSQAENIVQETPSTEDPSTLLIWGAIIPKNSKQTALSHEILDLLTQPTIQASYILETPLNSTLRDMTIDFIPLKRRPSALRESHLKDIYRIESKNPKAKEEIEKIWPQKTWPH